MRRILAQIITLPTALLMVAIYSLDEEVFTDFFIGSMAQADKDIDGGISKLMQRFNETK